jgi:diaminohydroxyphosphoribosylaminopyrimidine deaminase/5-amino-6-(5-phosphoribosylamino)uracil reductase
MDDEKFMRAALREARRGLGQTSPNPAVGAVIVRAGRIVARGHHRRAGLPHAEIEALQVLRQPQLARRATLYVTLEPCSTHGRTPPCVEAIVRHSFARVVIGAIDPNPAHAGRGVELLRAAGIDVVTGVLESECRELNVAFNKWIVTGLPFVIAKAALSLDGRLTRPPGEGQWLSNAASRADAHRLRASVDAILIGAGTLRADNPRLTVRGVPARANRGGSSSQAASGCRKTPTYSPTNTVRGRSSIVAKVCVRFCGTWASGRSRACSSRAEVASWCSVSTSVWLIARISISRRCSAADRM